MPTYLLHGFRWPRPLIRIHIILQNLDDAAAEWLVAPNTTLALLKNFNQLYPECMEYLPRLRFIEQYDPSDTSPGAASQPFAYVADTVEEIRLGVEFDEVRGRGLNNEQWTSIMELRDRLAPEEKVGWYIVVCGDEERYAPPLQGDIQASSYSNVTSSDRSQSPVGYSNSRDMRAPRVTSRSPARLVKDQKKPPTPPEAEPKGLRKLFGSARLGKRKR